MTRYLLAATIILLSACNNNATEKSVAQDTAVAQEKPNFIPVTSFIKGQMHEITERGITPEKFITINDHTDSALVKFDSLTDFIQEFLQPRIDSANLTPFFSESKFLDQTINAFTFTYNPKTILPDSIPLTHWDVYIDPETSKIKRVYMTKKSSTNKILQLTWQSNEWCQIITISNNPDGSSKVEKEEKVLWVY